LKRTDFLILKTNRRRKREGYYHSITMKNKKTRKKEEKEVKEVKKKKK